MESRHCGPDVDWTASIAIADKMWRKILKWEKWKKMGAMLQSATTKKNDFPRAKGATAEWRRGFVFTSSEGACASDWVLLSGSSGVELLSPPVEIPLQEAAGGGWPVTTTRWGSETTLQYLTAFRANCVSQSWWWAVRKTGFYFDGISKHSSCVYGFLNRGVAGLCRALGPLPPSAWCHLQYQFTACHICPKTIVRCPLEHWRFSLL